MTSCAVSEANALETVACPYCGSTHEERWAEEAGFAAVRCLACGIIYCNPRPARERVDAAVRTGVHGGEAHGLDVRARRVAGKVRYYRRALGALFDDVWRAGAPVSWLDVGAGYGEVLEAVAALAPAGSRVEGLEPMKPKAEAARRRGLTVTEGYLAAGHALVDIVSVVDVFSHVPSFGDFLADVRAVLRPGGELFLQTGNLADLARRDEYPGELGLPDHLVFAGERHVLGYLERAGFAPLRVERRRTDTLVEASKNVVKLLLGRPGILRAPYTSSYRQLLVRARLRTT
jgi:SAM-dependent methyltransferase